MSIRNMSHLDQKGQARIYKISISPQKGEKKKNVAEVDVIAGQGIDGDAHGGSHRPISLLPHESFVKVKHPDLVVNPGDFAENITTLDLDFTNVKVGTRLRLGLSVELEVIQIGKKCHNGCIIRQLVGDCIMPREGVFARVLASGKLCEGDSIRILN